MLEGIEKFQRGYLPKDLVQNVKKHANDSFTCPLHQDDYEFELLPKLPDGLIYSGYSGVMLKLRNCEPHTDFYVGENVAGYQYVGTSFGLVHGKGIIQVANDYMHLAAGDWILFDDTKLHSVQSDKTWVGVSVQVLQKV